MTEFSALITDLKKLLSEDTRIVRSEETISRWDISCSPDSVITVFPRCERDVSEIIKFCSEKKLKCFAQSGGHVDEASQSVTLGGGTLISELIEEVTKKKLEVATGVCNSVGALGSLLYGGTGRHIGKYGYGIDNLLSINLVDATGKLHQNVNETTDPELWWAIRGAGASFGIVTQATIKAYPQSNNGLSWICTLIFSEPSASKLEMILSAISETEMNENMSLQFSFAYLPPTLLPTVIVVPWYYGPQSEAEKAWARLLDPNLQPTLVEPVITSANKLNEGNDVLGEKGGKKPVVGLGLDNIDPVAFREIWDLWVKFVSENPDAVKSGVFVERFYKSKALEVSDDATVFPYANRAINYEAICVPSYNDDALGGKVQHFTQSIREIWLQKCNNTQKPRSYGASAGLNEPLESLFGDQEKIERLLRIKKRWDPQNNWGALFDFP
ncbi:hypothetical protein Dda_2434 [Drechslerella dactyloides]|uniref:FAD-binding PCMH-type domain-containing protein n=1 Tax=Drechslerella dactyloides TaxID=74499 RepID=A0AAD6J7H0_DREDA|nr:hypothetical protein Dda_2434 [Drechslerella dactyloides]